MADTEQSEQPQTNGLENGLDEDEKSKMRPADIDADVKEMERRKRVEMIMNSKLFREELERIIELQMKDGNGPAGLLQQISDMMGIQSGKLHTNYMFRGSNCVTPINDIRGVESMGYEKGEKNLRCKLASVFRLMDLYGWSQGINNQVTARLNQDEEHFLVNAHGMLFNEITASSLVKVDMQGNIVEPGTTNFGVNTQGFLLHSAIHASRPDVNCAIHIKTPSVLAVSSLKCGLLPLCQEALVIGEVSQHPFLCGIFEPEEREKIIRNFGPSNKVLLLHNNGAVCCGATVEEAFYNVYNTVLACETQIKLMPVGVENLVLVNDETRKQVYDAAHRSSDSGTTSEKKPKQFRVGELEFEALIRMLDNAGFRTGYIYRHPLVKGELPKPKNDVEVPPAVSSLGYLIEQEELYKQGNWKKYIYGRNGRAKWLNSPNVYQKVEILETGTSDPKKITKWVDQNSEEWVAESSPTHSSTPVKIDSALQFVPKGTNPREFKKLQQQIKENRRADKITSGPQSHILEGVSWEEAKKLQDANITQTGDQVILVGAASKGIIQRDYQHHALVYKTPYAKNPFDSMSDKEIEDYKQLIERKQRGDTDYEESQSESEAISSSRQDGHHRFKSPLLSPQSATSETEEESRDEPRVLRIETKTAPRPIQAEVVLSDAESDSTDARVERSHSARYPKAEKPESVKLMNSFRKSWSLKREKDKSKDEDNPNDPDSRNFHPSSLLIENEHERADSLHYCIARIKQLTHKPAIIDISPKALRPLLKSASDPCNLDRLSREESVFEGARGDNLNVSVQNNASRSCSNIASDLQRRLNIRKKLIYSAKMKFLGLQGDHPQALSEEKDLREKASTSPMCALISEIRETISEIVSPERSKKSEEPTGHSSLKWLERRKFVVSMKKAVREDDESEECPTFAQLLHSFARPESRLESLNDLANDLRMLEKSDDEDGEGLPVIDAGEGFLEETSGERVTEKQTPGGNERNEGKMTERITNASDEEAEDSLLPTYSFTESTETEWYYNKTIMNLDNSQTVLEIKEVENKEANDKDVPVIRCTDTGIDTDFTSEKENEPTRDNPTGKIDDAEPSNAATDDKDAEAPLCESSVLNKSSETDSSLLKSSSGRTSNDVDTSFIFKTETDNSEKTNEQSSPVEVSSINLHKSGGRKGIPENLSKEDEDSGESAKEKKTESHHAKLPGIPESPEFTNVDTEDAPITSSSKDTSPEVINPEQLTEDEPAEENREEEVDSSKEKETEARGGKRRKNKKSSTKITVKKELKGNSFSEPIVSEIKLTIKNSKPCQSEKYEVKIQDLTNTSEEMSSSLGDNVESFETYDLNNKSCDCDALRSLKDLQGEVSTSVEKLQTIESYFENEISKHSAAEKGKNGDLTIEYNYREFEDMLNESRDERNVSEKKLDASPEPLRGIAASEALPNLNEDSSGSFETGYDCQNEKLDGSEEPHGGKTFLDSGEDQDGRENDRHAFELVPEEDANDDGGCGRKSSGNDDGSSAPDSNTALEGLEYFVKSLRTLTGETILLNGLDLLRDLEACDEVRRKSGEDDTADIIFKEDWTLEKNNSFDMRGFIEGIIRKDCFGVEEPSRASGNAREEILRATDGTRHFLTGIDVHGDENARANKSVERVSACETAPVKQSLQFHMYLRLILARLKSPLQAISYCDDNNNNNNDDDAVVSVALTRRNTDNCRYSGLGGHILSQLLSGATAEDFHPSINDVTKFILSNEESPTNSLAEFENVENPISTSNSVTADVVDSTESQLEEVESLPDEDFTATGASNSAQKKKDDIIKVTIATPSRKEIFINYSQNRKSTSFDLSSDFEFCNSYIKTDDVNDDYESFNSDGTEFFSVGSPGKISVDTSFSLPQTPADDNPVTDQFSCAHFEGGPLVKSPRSLSIIQEVDEGESSISSEVCSTSVSVDI